MAEAGLRFLPNLSCLDGGVSLSVRRETICRPVQRLEPALKANGVAVWRDEWRWRIALQMLFKGVVFSKDLPRFELCQM